MNESNISLWEQKLIQVIFPELEKGRPNWDLPHTKAVVSYMKEILTHYPSHLLDHDVLVIAAYAHDWGYSELFQEGKAVDLTTIKSAKILHMEIGAKKLSKLLQDGAFANFSDQRKSQAVALVAKHDRLNDLSTLAELVLMEADTLGALDTSAVASTFSPEDEQRYLISVENKRLPLFVTEFAKSKSNELISNRQNR